MDESNISTLAGIGIAAMLCQWIAWQVKLPAILFLLLTGLIAGPIMGWLNPDVLLGNLLFPFVSLSVAVILFEGSLTLQFHEIRGLEKVVRRLVGSGMLIMWLVTTVATRWIMNFSWELSFLFGAITVVTGPTVIMPLLRTVRPVKRVANALRWEGIVIDPIGALLAVLVFEVIVSRGGGEPWGHALLTFGRVIGIGLGIGLGAGFAVGEILRRYWIADYLINVTVLAVVFAVFALSNALQSESGLLSVTVMGVWMANRKGLPLEGILAFKETLSLMLLSVLFIILAARIDFESFQTLGWAAPMVLAVMLLIARPLKVLFSTWGSSLNWRERVLLAWIAPSGIVAAAVSALFAFRLEAIGFERSGLIVPLTFMVIIGTVLLQSATARTVAVKLKVAEPDPTGFLIVGANPVARAIGKALHNRGVSIVLCDSNWDSLGKARMAGLPTYYGSPVSEEASRYLDLSSLGHVLALSPEDNFNALVAARYQDEFGRNAVYILRSSVRKDESGKHQAAELCRGNTLFSKDVSYWELAHALDKGATIRSTTLSDSFDFEQYKSGFGGVVIPLFAVDPKGKTIPFSAESILKPRSGWTVIGLVPKDAPEQTSIANGEIK